MKNTVGLSSDGKKTLQYFSAYAEIEECFENTLWKLLKLPDGEEYIYMDSFTARLFADCTVVFLKAKDSEIIVSAQVEPEKDNFMSVKDIVDSIVAVEIKKYEKEMGQSIDEMIKMMKKLNNNNSLNKKEEKIMKSFFYYCSVCKGYFTGSNCPKCKSSHNNEPPN